MRSPVPLGRRLRTGTLEPNRLARFCHEYIAVAVLCSLLAS